MSAGRAVPSRTARPEQRAAAGCECPGEEEPTDEAGESRRGAPTSWSQGRDRRSLAASPGTGFLPYRPFHA
jgi:hypothetical protein